MEAKGNNRSRLKVIFAPSRRSRSVPDYRLIENIYPRNDYVGCSAYNKSSNRKNLYTSIFRNVLDYLDAETGSSKRFGFSETGIEQKNRRPDWITENYTEIISRAYNLSYHNYYDSDGGNGQPWELNDADSQTALANAFSSSFLNGR